MPVLIGWGVGAGVVARHRGPPSSLLLSPPREQRLHQPPAGARTAQRTSSGKCSSANSEDLGC